MFRPPADASDGEPIEILGLGAGSEFGETETDFPVGRRVGASPAVLRRRHPSPKRWLMIGAAGAIVTVGFVFGNRDSSTPETAPRSTATPPASASSEPGRAEPEPTQVLVPTTTSPLSPTTAEPAAIGPIFATKAGYGIYLFNEGSGPSLARLDLATGALRFPLSPPDLSASDRILGVAGSPADSQTVWASDVGDASWAPCSDGTVWVLKRDDRGLVAALQRLRFRPGMQPEIEQSVDTSHGLQDMSASTLGTTIDDRPIVSGPDRRGYVVDPASGTLIRQTDGPLLSVQHGAYVESRCDDTANCTLALHSGLSSVVSLYAGTNSQVSFSPDGSHALMMRTASEEPSVVTDLLLIDMDSRRIAALDEAPKSATGFWATGPSGAHWSPDGAAVFYENAGSIVRVDVARQSVASFELPAPLAGMWDIVTIT